MWHGAEEHRIYYCHSALRRALLKTFARGLLSLAFQSFAEDAKRG